MKYYYDNQTLGRKNNPQSLCTLLCALPVNSAAVFVSLSVILVRVQNLLK